MITGKQVLYRSDGLYQESYHMAPVDDTDANVFYLTKADLPWLRMMAQCTLDDAYYLGWFDSSKPYMIMHVPVVSGIASYNLANRLKGFCGNIIGSIEDHLDRSKYGLHINKRYHDGYVKGALDALRQACNTLEALPSECTNELYKEYYRTGVYYADHVVRYSLPGGGKEIRLAVPLSAELARDHQQMRTETAALEACEITLYSAITSNESRQKIHKAMKESYESEIHYSKIIRWGLTGLMGVAAVVLIVLIVMAFVKKNS